MSESYTIPPLTQDLYSTYYVDNSINDFFVALKYYLSGIGVTNHRLVETTTGSIKRRIGVGNRAVSNQDIQKLCDMYSVCIFMWDYAINTWLPFGEVFSCDFKILMFREGERYGYVMRKQEESGSVRTRRGRITQSTRRYSPD